MGAAILKPRSALPPAFPKLIEETQFFSLWKISDVKELYKRLRLQVYGYALVEAQFESIMAFKEDFSKQTSIEVLFDILDNDHDGRIDGLELLGGLALCCQATFEEKARFCFELYDFNLTSSISKQEMIMMMMASICGMNLLTGGGEELEPDVDTIELLSDEAFLRADREKNGLISYEEFVSWVRSNRHLMAALESLNKVALDAKLDVESDDSAPETDDGDLSDIEPAIEQGATGRTEISNRDNTLISSQSIAHAISARLQEIKSPLSSKVSGISMVAAEGAQTQSTLQWRGQIYEPTSTKASKRDMNGPKTNLELCWAFGCRTKNGSRNNLFYVGAGGTYADAQRVAYPAASLGIVYDMQTNEQVFYQGHSEEISCMALHPTGTIIATGDVASNIHIWKVSTMTCQCIIKGISTHGIQHLAFSPSGDRIASVGYDPDHTMAIYDTASGEIVSSAKGLSSPNNVNDVAYSNNGTEIATVGKYEIKIYSGVNTSKRALDSYNGRIGKMGRKQTYLCVVYFNDDIIVGCASGELYRLRSGQCVQIIQAHGIKEPILCISVNSREGVLVTGGKDSLVRTWDSTLNEVGASLDMSESLNGNGMPGSGLINSAVISVCLSHNRVLVGTRGGDIFEAILPANGRANDAHSLNRIAWSHCVGQFWGLAVHPLRDEFATSGSDKTLRIWSIRSKEQMNARTLPEAVQAIAYSPQGDIIAVGMVDGSIGIVDAESESLKATSTWKYCSQAITDLKFSPDGTLLAVGCKDGNIYVYVSNIDENMFRRKAVCRGHASAVTHIDFSSNSQYLQSNSSDCALLFWDVLGNPVKSAASMRDCTWATMTCVYGWAVQGIYSDVAGSTSLVNACSALPTVGDIVTGSTDQSVKLYRYPAIYPESLHQSYTGHSSSVSCVRFSYNRRHVISLGESDNTILLWTHTMEDTECSDDEEQDPRGREGGQLGTNASRSKDSQVIESRNEIGNVGPRSLLQEAINSNQPVEIIAQIARLEGHTGSEKKVQPWKGVIVEPSSWSHEKGGTDVDLNLQWIHGYRCHDCRNNVRYSAAGSIVFTAAAVGVVYSRSAGKQKFFRGAHADDIIGLAAHPAGQLFATGETGRQPSIIVWSSEDMRYMARIECSHLNGVPLLAFNSKGNMLASVGLDDNHTLVVHDWVKNVTVLRTPTDKREVYCICYLGDSLSDSEPSGPIADSGLRTAASHIIVTAGYKHVKFWWSRGQNVSSQRGIFGKEKRDVFLCVASGTSGVCLTGSSSGTLLLWQDFKVVSNVGNQYGEAVHEVGQYPHLSPIQAMWAIPGKVDQLNEGDEPGDVYTGLSASSRYITGDKEGLVVVWRLMCLPNSQLRLKLVSILDVSTLCPAPVCSSVRSLCERNGTILIGTLGSEIYEVFEDSMPTVQAAFIALKTQRDKRDASSPSTIQSQHVPPPTYNNNSEVKDSEISRHKDRGALDVQVRKEAVSVPALRIMSGHYKGELSGLAVHPNLPVYVTCGDDGYIRCWSLVNHKLLSYMKISDKLRAIDIHPVDGREIAVSMSSGAVWVIKAKVLLNPKSVPLVEVDLTLYGYEAVLNAEVLQTAHRIAQSTASQPSVTPAVAPLGIRPPCDVLVVISAPNLWVQELKYCFDGSVLGVGCRDGTISLFDVSNSYAPRTTSHLLSPVDGVPIKHDSFITQFDFGVILESSPEGILSYDEVNRKIITSQWLAGSDNILRNDAAGVSSSVRQGMKSSTSADLSVTDDDIKKKGLVVLSTRDLTANDICIQSVCGAGELLFWRLDGTPIRSVETVKDAWWSTWTAPVGWPVQGIWPPGVDSAEYSINAVARSYSYRSVPVLATADEYGRVKIFNYPCVTPGSPDKCYKGHSSNITNIKFSSDDAFCITIGGSDRCVFVWGTDIIEERRVREAMRGSGSKGGGRGGELRLSTATEEHESFLPFKDVVPKGGDENMAIKPWLGAVRVPSVYTEPADLGEAPSATLELKFVYGYRGWDCRNNISYADSSHEILYHVGAVGIAFNIENQTQILNTEHDDDILCLAVHPEGHTVATGEIGPQPKIVLWDANTGVTLSVIRYHKKGVSNVFFSTSGLLLISVGMDEDRSIAVHNVKTSALVGTGKGGRGVDIYTISVGGDDKFVTGGKNHIKFWGLPSPTSAGGELSSKGGLYGKNVTARTVISSAFIGSDCVTGMTDGTLVLWKDRNSTKCIKGHDGPVTAMCSVGGRMRGSSVSSGGMITGMSGGSGETSAPCIITGGKDGFVHVYSAQLLREWSLDLNLSSPPSALPQIQALAAKDGKILIGTKASEIYETNRLNTAEMFRFVQGHYGPTAEVWGLAVHPLCNKFCTSGDDESVRLWDAKALQQVMIIGLGAKIRALAYNNDGSHLGAATFDGRIIILSGDLQKKLYEVSVAKSWIQTMSYSPDGHTLAVGSHDNQVYLLNTQTYNCRATCKGHHSYITALDFSSQGDRLQTTSGDYELLFWDAADGHQILSATEMKDVQWATCTCTLGWGVQGIWPAGADGTDVNAVDRSPDGSLIATGDDFRRVKIFKYPCPKERSKFKEHKGHAEFVTNVKFSKDGSWLYTVGGLDKAVCQFDVKAGTERNDQLANLVSSTTPATSIIVRSEVASKSRTKKK